MFDFLEKRPYSFWIILTLILTIPTFIQLLRPGFFFMQDDLQAFRVHQMFRCFQDLQIPCRWVPDMGYQYGYPQFLFYPPIVYYIGAFIHLFGIQIIDSVKILFILGYILSTVFMFIFLKAFFDGEVKEKSFATTTLPALLGAMLYTYVPYKALEIYVRGALSEFWSLILYPLVFWAVYQLITKNKLKYLIFLSLSTAFLLITHNLMTLIFAPIALLWCLVLLIIKNRWKMIPKFFFGGILGIGLASFFTLPVIFEGKFVHLETLQGGYFDYRQHFVSLYRLLISNLWGYGSSGLGQDNNLTLSTGQIHWMLGLLGLILAFAFFKKQKNMAILAIVFSITELAVLFLIHQKSSFIWEKLPVLWWLQFPWRFLTDSIFLLSFLGAITVFFVGLLNKKIALIFALFILAATFILHSQFFTPKDWVNISDTDKFSGKLWEKQLTISIFDYLPIYAKLPPNHKAPKFPEVLEGQANFLNYQKGSNFQTGEVEVKKEALIRLPLFDFPGMKVTAGGNTLPHTVDCRGEEYCFGLISFKLSPGKYKIKAQLQDTPVRQIGNIITLISIIAVLGLYLKTKK
ncbi:MAG: Uncharacterized protein G01um10147_74 [Microgenomates group bacterium Gr01-1014_7]|nr:MAG: Uncharacterized protein G01um10147_74 [Microgenomates group bacterium Gr01-1014_7]